MALDWMWAFGAESALILETMGWDFGSTNPAFNAPATTQQYTYAGSPTRYSMTQDQTQTLVLPTTTSAPAGWVAVAIYHDAVAMFANYYIPAVQGAVASRIIGARSLASGALALYVDNVFKSSTAVVVWQGQWNYVALRYDMSTTTYSGQIWVNGVALTAVETDVATTAETAALFVIQGAATGSANSQHVAQIVVWNDLADPGEVARFVTRLDVDADVSEVGTWTPSAGGTNFGVVGGTFDAATYTEEAVPSASDDVIVTLAADMTSKLGIAPTTIDGVTAHTYSNGLGQTARAEVGDGVATTAGATGAISSGTTERHVTAPTKPSGGAWAGSDTPTAKYFIVSV